MTVDPTWLWIAGAVALGILVLLVWVVVQKGRPFTSGDVFRASRWSSGNRLFPTQVAITRDSVVQYTPQWIGHREEVIHMAHIASVKIATGALLSDIEIETSGGSDPILCHGHTKSDATKIKALVEQYQGAYYRNRPV
ncbi:MAG TPA: hypothetical protein VLV86_11685 [Vicinamibacterales bacterium]|nr:hypothetical protein [Vicinamibacterales bacterium]